MRGRGTERYRQEWDSEGEGQREAQRKAKGQRG